MSAFGGKADIIQAIAKRLLLTQSGDWPASHHGGFRSACSVHYHDRDGPWGGDETAQVPYAFWRRGSEVAVRGQRTEQLFDRLELELVFKRD
jgi:hypothetical protein